MKDAHIAAGIAVLVLNFAGGAWGGITWLRHRASFGFWYVLRAAQLAVVIEVILGGIVLLDHSAGDDLHYIYGGLPLLVALIAEGARAGAAGQELGDTDFESLPIDTQRQFALAIVRRETGIMAISCIVVFFLALRAAATG